MLLERTSQPLLWIMITLPWNVLHLSRYEFPKKKCLFSLFFPFVKLYCWGHFKNCKLVNFQRDRNAENVARKQKYLPMQICEIMKHLVNYYALNSQPNNPSVFIIICSSCNVLVNLWVYNLVNIIYLGSPASLWNFVKTYAFGWTVLSLSNIFSIYLTFSQSHFRPFENSETLQKAKLRAFLKCNYATISN